MSDQGVALGVEEIRLTKAFYNWPSEEPFFVPDGVRERFQELLGTRGRKAREAWFERFESYREAHPELAEELWSLLDHDDSLAYAPWPVADERVLVADTISLVVQHNGKKRGEIEVAADADDATIEAAALAVENVQKSLGGRDPKKVIVVPGRLVNIVG